MTREERDKAIEILQWLHGNNFLFRSTEDNVKYATKLAIQALEQEPCEDAVSRQAVLYKAVYTETENGWNGRTVDVKDIEALPPVTPQQKTGRWISFGEKGEIDGQIVRTFTCSECGAISIFRVTNGNIVNGDLCPNCGAKMQEVKENG